MNLSQKLLSFFEEETRINIMSEIQEFISAITDVFSDIEDLLEINRPYESLMLEDKFDPVVAQRKTEQVFSKLDKRIKRVENAIATLKNYANKQVTVGGSNAQGVDVVLFLISALITEMEYINRTFDSANNLRIEHSETYNKIQDVYFEAKAFVKTFTLTLKQLEDELKLSKSEYERLEKILESKKLCEAVLKWDELKQFAGQSSIPEIGFIRPDGAFIDITKHGADHIEFAKKVMESINESEYSNMLEFTEQGYIRFKNEDGLSVIQASTYPTRPQFSAIQRSVDVIGKGIFEVFKNKVAVDYLRMTRDTLDADMRKLEALLNKVKPPQPKIS